MKNSLLLALFVGAATLIGCTNNSMAIKGTVADSTLNGKTVYLLDVVADKVIDSAVVTEAKFTFNKDVDSLTILSVNIGRTRATILAQVGEVTVELGRPSKVGGTQLNDMFTTYSVQSDSLTTQMRERYQILSNLATEFKGADSVANMAAFQESADEMYAQYETDSKALADSYIVGNEGNALGVLLQMNGLMSKYNYELAQIDSVLAVSNPAVANIARVKEMRNAAINRDKTSAGDMFTDFDGVTADGQPTKLSDFVGKGNYVLLDFWASWCGPCRRAMPEIKALYQKYKAAGFVVVGANVWDTKDGFEKAIVELALPWAQICNFESRTPTELYGVMGIPQLVLFAPDGTIVERNLHGETLTKALATAYKR